MSQNKPPKKTVSTSNKKKVVTTSKPQKGASGNKKKLSPTVAKAKVKEVQQAPQEVELLFGQQQYLLMGGGFLLLVIGLFLMSGGAMPSPDVWDENIIYGARRTIVAPLVILAGLILEIVAIFKR